MPERFRPSMLEIWVSSCKDLKTSSFECFCIVMLYHLEKLYLLKVVLMFKSFLRDDENYSVYFRSSNLHCVIPLLKVDSRRPWVIEILAGFSTPACFSKLLNSEMMPSFALFRKYQSAGIVHHWQHPFSIISLESGW